MELTLRALARAVVALVKGGRPNVVTDVSWVGDAACKREMPPAKPRPPTPGEMAGGKRP